MKNNQQITALFSCAGRKKANQDAVLSEELDNGSILLAIADGMGGEFGGEVASSLAINTVRSALVTNPDLPLADVFKLVHNELIKLAQQDPSLERMGTTLSVCVINKGEALVAHCGDTRIYHLRGDGLIARTKDQTECQLLLDEGVLSKEKAKTYYRKHILLSVMSPNWPFDLFTNTFDVEPKDRILLLSDGAYSLLEKREIISLSKTSSGIGDAISQIKNVIESREIMDDYSVIGLEAKE